MTLQVLGGYVAGCASRTLDPANTTLQGDGADRVLALTATNGGALTVEGVTISGGVRTGDGGGLYASTVSNITLRDNMFQDNTGHRKGRRGLHRQRKYDVRGAQYLQYQWWAITDTDQGGGLYVFTDRGSLAMTNNTFDDEHSAHSGRRGVCSRPTLGTLSLTENSFDEQTRTGSGQQRRWHLYSMSQSSGIATLAGNHFVDNSNTLLSDSIAVMAAGAYVDALSGQAALTNNNFLNNKHAA